jgi:hypothetical protein
MKLFERAKKDSGKQFFLLSTLGIVLIGEALGIFAWSYTRQFYYADIFLPHGLLQFIIIYGPLTVIGCGCYYLVKGKAHSSGRNEIKSTIGVMTITFFWLLFFIPDF